MPASADPSATPPSDSRPARGRRGRDLGAIALALLALIWGYNWVVMKIGLEYASRSRSPPCARSSAPSACSCCSLVLRRPLRPAAVGLTIVIGLLQTTGFVGLIMWALQSGGAGKTSVLTYTMPFWLLLLAWVFLGERLRGVQWLAVALAFGGPPPRPEPVAPAGRLQQPARGGRRVLLGRQRGGGQAAAATAPRGHPLAHDLADAVRLAAAHRHRRAHLHRSAGVDRRLHLGPGLQRHPGQRPRLVPLAVRAPRAVRRRRGHRDAGDPPHRRRRRVDPARRAAPRARPPAWRSSSAPSPS